jgi:hypothetical protein
LIYRETGGSFYDADSHYCPTAAQKVPSQGPAARLIGNIVGAVIVRLIGAVLLEANDEGQLQHRCMRTEAMAEPTPPIIDAVPAPVSTVAA